MLTDTKCKNAGAKAKPYKLSDGDGLVLEVRPPNRQGRVVKAWRLRFTFDGKESMLALGEYPAVSLKEARAKRDEARDLIAKGINPSAQRRLDKITRTHEASNTVSAVAQQWIGANDSHWSERYAKNILQRLRVDVFPTIGEMPIKDVTPKVLLAVLKKVHERSPAQAKLLQTWLGGLFRYAVAHLMRDDDPLWALRGAIKADRTKHHPHLEGEIEIGKFLRAIEAATSDLQVLQAAMFSWFTVARINEVTDARWSEIDLDAGLWRIPGSRMKGRHDHAVPLSPQARTILEALKPYTGSLEHVFPHRSDRRRSMSTAAIRDLYRRAGYGGRFSPHGVRGTFSTHFNGKGADARLVEMCLAHAERNAIKGAYDHAKRIPERLALLTEWANMLDTAKQGAKVVQLRKVG